EFALGGVNEYDQSVAVPPGTLNNASTVTHEPCHAAPSHHMDVSRSYTITRTRVTPTSSVADPDIANDTPDITSLGNGASTTTTGGAASLVRVKFPVKEWI
ncbi:unnamed protein product, partial [marine sediment metagenome]